MIALSRLGQSRATRHPLPWIAGCLASPAIAVFLSNNAANVGNLAYNMVFSRWLGPEMFGALATLLTLKLSLLAVLNALQLAVSQRVSAQETVSLRATLVWLDRRLLLTFAASAAVLVPLALSGRLTSALGLPNASASALAVLLLALPVTAPLCLARGVAMGRLASGGIVASGQAEMAVRFVGGVLAWQAGLGLVGVVAALAVSLVAGWLPLRSGLQGAEPRLSKPDLRALTRLALPFAALQVAQVALLDGDVIASNLMLSGHEAGLMAVLALFQRIQFYACFGLAGVLLPAVSAAVARGETGLKQARPILLIYLGLTLPLLVLMTLIPGWMIGVVAGSDFAPAAPALLATGVSAACFTGSYLAATLLAAWRDRRGLVLVALAVPVQAAAYAIISHLLPGFGLGPMTLTKACVQAVLLGLLIGLVLIRLRRGPVRSVSTINI